MSKLSNYISEVVGDTIALFIGWLVCISVLAGAFALGRWAAPHFGWDGSRDTFGLLSALTVLWLYEHRNAEGKYDRLRELIEHRNSN